MSGYGIYLYADGIRYDGQFLLDKKEGFGIYKWTDGRMYEGWWHKGKQHGPGTYHDTAKKSVRNGLWENGKRLKWYDEQETQSVAQGKIEYRRDFVEPASADVFPKLVNFAKPVDFNRKLKEVKTKLNITWN
jgi:hypothetical protein